MTATSHFVKALAFSEDGTQLYSVAEDGTIRRWDIRSGELVAETQTGQMMRSAAFTQALDSVIYISYRVVEIDEMLERVYDATEISRFTLSVEQ